MGVIAPRAVCRMPCGVQYASDRVGYMGYMKAGTTRGDTAAGRGDVHNREE